MSFHKILILSLIVGLFLQSAVVAAPVSTITVKDSNLTPELKQKAVKILSSVARETEQLRLPENRVQAQTIVMDLLWENDEREARSIMEGVFGELKNMFDSINAKAVEPMTVKEKTEYYYKRQKLAELRLEFIRTLARRDPSSALTAFNALKAKKLEGYDPLEATKLELEIISAMAKTDPEKTIALAKEQIAKGITHEIIESLKDLHRRDSQIAAKIGREILAFIKNAVIRPPSAGNSKSEETDSNNSVTVRIAKAGIDFGVAASFLNTASELNRVAARDKDKKMIALLTEAEMKELAETVARAFLAANESAQYSISQVMPEISRYAPAQAQRIRLKVGAEIVRDFDRVVKNVSEYRAREVKNADELAKEAERAAPDSRDYLFSEALRKALEENEPEKAQAIAARIKDRESYGYLIEQIEIALPLAKARRGDAAEVRKMLIGLKTNQERATVLTELAATLAVKGDKENAKKLLEESLQLLFTTPVSQAGVAEAGKIAAVYALVAPDEAFTIVEIGIEQMNSYIDAGIKLDEFYDYGAVTDGELLYDAMNRQLLLHLPNSTDLLKNLARADFERTFNLTNKFVRPEIRAFARLRILQTLLDPEVIEKEKQAREKIENQDEH